MHLIYNYKNELARLGYKNKHNKLNTSLNLYMSAMNLHIFSFFY